MKLIFHLLVSILPWRLKKWIYIRICGFDIGQRCHVGFSCLNVKELKLVNGSKIGSLNMFKGLKLRLEENATIGSLNWFTSLYGTQSFQHSVNRNPILILGRESAITSRHYFDVQDSVEIGEYTTLAGIRTTVFTHGINVSRGRQSTAPIRIGAYCYIGSNCIVLPGAILPSYCVLAAGALLVGREREEEYCLYAGVPATKRKTLDRDSLYFLRKCGVVD